MLDQNPSTTLLHTTMFSAEKELIWDGLTLSREKQPITSIWKMKHREVSGRDPFTHMACRAQSATQRGRDPSQWLHHPSLYAATCHMGSAASDPARARLPPPSPETSQRSHLRVGGSRQVTIRSKYGRDEDFSFAHLSCRARSEAFPTRRGRQPPPWTRWPSPVQTYSCSTCRPSG